VAVAVFFLSVGLMYLSAYNGAMQRTLGLLLTEKTGGEERSRTQVAIILGMQLGRINMMFLLGLAVYLIIARASAWYYGVFVVILCGVGSLLVRSILNLQPGSPKMLAAIASDLERRRELYKNGGDSLRLQAVEELLARLRAFPGFRYSLR
jgi:hypothetical protein